MSIDLTFAACNGWVTLGSVLRKHVISRDHEHTFVVKNSFALFFEFFEIILRIGNRVAGFTRVV
jgi:hypothetical protein